MRKGHWIKRLLGGKATGRGRGEVAKRRRPDAVAQSGRVEAPIWHNPLPNGKAEVRFFVNRDEGPSASRRFTRELRIGDVPDLFVTVCQLASLFLQTNQLPRWLELELRLVVNAYGDMVRRAEESEGVFERKPSRRTKRSGK